VTTFADNGFILVTEGLTKVFDGIVALDRVDIAMRAGTIHGLIGPNGSGKTTFFNVVTGMLPASGGRVAFDSDDITGQPSYAISRLGVGRTFQGGLVLPFMTCLENVMCGMHSHLSLDIAGTFFRLPFTRSRQEKRCAAAAREWLEFVGLESSAARPASDLVWVERQLLQVARALATSPQLLLLDEPTSGMGPEETERVCDIIRRIRESGVTVSVISHDVGLVVELCDAVSVLSYGEKIFEGQPQEAQTDPRVLEVYLGTD
jgi:branched-chain amino acid transport system ATP-binding protein